MLSASASSASRRLVFAIVLAVLLITPIRTIWMVFALYDDVPSQDQLSFFVYDRIGDGLHLANAFAFFNQHQMVFTRLAVYSGYRFFHGSNVLSYVLNALLLLAVWGVYCVVLAQSGKRISRSQLAVGCGLLLSLYFNGRMLLNLTFPIMEFPWASFFSVSAFYLFSRVLFAPAEQGRGARMILLAAALIAAALSCAGGLLAGPSMLVVAACLLWLNVHHRTAIWRAGLPVLAMTCVIVGVYGGAYFGFSGQHHGAPRFDPWAIGRFIWVFVGGPFFNDSEWPIVAHASHAALYASCAGFWSLLIWLGVRFYRGRNHLSSFELFHWCAIVFVILTAFSGSILRSDLGSMEGLSKKYTPIALLAWMSAISLLIFYRPQRLFGKSPGWFRPLAICGAAVLALVPGDLLQYRMWRLWREQVRESASVAASGVYSSEYQRRLYYQNEAGYMASQAFARDGMYCYRRMPHPGYDLRSQFHIVEPLRSDLLAADIISINERPGREGFIATGNSESGNDQFPTLAITDDQDHVFGYGAIGGGKWLAAFRRPAGFSGSGTMRVYELHDSSATLTGKLSVTEAREIDPRVKASSTALARMPNNTDYNVDVFNGVGMPESHQPIHVPLRGDVDVIGWAVDRDRNALPAAVDALIDDRAYRVQTGSRRDDVAGYFRQPAFAWSGFSFLLPATGLGAGLHRFRIRVYTDQALHYFDSRVYLFLVQ